MHKTAIADDFLFRCAKARHMTLPDSYDSAFLKPSSHPRCRFDDDAWHWFLNAAAELEIPAGDEQREALENLYSHLVGVNTKLNLTRLTSPFDYLKFHVLDSLTVLCDIEDVSERGDVCADLGSGGGYPGLPLMLWVPERRWCPVDSKTNNLLFLNQAFPLTSCVHDEAVRCRGREVRSVRPDLAGTCQVVVARAVGRGDKVLTDAAPLLRANGFLILMKGPSYKDDERRAVERACEDLRCTPLLERVVTLEDGDPERTVLLVQKEETRRH